MSDNISKQNFFFNKPFGLNIHTPERTIKQFGDTIEHQVGGVFKPLADFLNKESHQDVFTGEVARKIESYRLNMYNTGVALRGNSTPPEFDTKA